MNFRTPDKPASIDIDLTPLINIVFLMLIFFMLAGTLSQGDTIQAAQMENASLVEDNPLVIVMALDRTLSVGGQPIERQTLTSLLKNTERAAGKIAIKPDSRLPAEALLSFTEELRRAGILEVTLIVEAP